MRNAALLIIDVQRDFMEATGRLPVDQTQSEEVIQNVNAVLAADKAQHLLPIYIGNEFRKYDILNLFRRFAAIESSAGCQLDPRMIIKSNHYFPKRRGDAFSNPDLVSFLRSNSIEEVYLAGVQAEACVFCTLKGARKHGFKSSVIKDAVASRTARRRQQMIPKYVAEGAEVVSSRELIE